MTKRWISFALVLILLLCAAACAQRTPPPDKPVVPDKPAASEITAEPEAPKTTEAEEETEPETETETEPEPETESETEPETKAGTEPTTEGVTEPLEPTDPPANTGVSTGTSLNPADFDLFAFRSGFEVRWYADHETVNSQFAALVGRNTATTAGTADTNVMTEGDFLALLPGYQKVIYSLIGGKLVIGETAYQIAAEDYAAMKALYDDPTLAGPTYPQWLVYMDLSRITGARILTEASGQIAAVTDSSRIAAIAAAARFSPVSPGTGNTSGYVQRQITPKGNTFKLWLDFDGGSGKQGDLFYTLTFEETTLLVESSDLGYGCLYTISPDSAAKLRGVLDQSAHTPLQAPTYATDAAGNPVNPDANPA